MAHFETDIQELLTKNESDTPLEVETGIEGQGEVEASAEGADRARGKKGGANKKETKEYRKKKQDALEGKDNKSHKEGREESKESRERREDGDDESHHSAKHGDTADASSHSRQGLSSGQTTVQFSSGGSMSATLTSLLGLFASSANLAKAETGSFLNLNAQIANQLIRSAFQTHTNITMNLLGEEGKNVKGLNNVSTTQSSESSGYKFSVEIGSITSSHNSSGTQEFLGNLLKNISVRALEGDTGLGNTNTLTIFTLGIGTTFIHVFNPNSFFPSPSTQFAFASQAQPFASSVVISKYLNEAGLPVSSRYTYELLSPIPTQEGGLYSNGLTFKQPTVGALTMDLQGYTKDFAYPSNTEYGLTLSPTGDLFVNVKQPMSVLVNVYTAGSSIPLPVRIDAAPGIPGPGSNGAPANIVTQPNQLGAFIGEGVVNNTMMGLLDPYNSGHFINTLFIDNPSSGVGGANSIVGNAMAISLNSRNSLGGTLVNSQGNVMPDYNLLYAQGIDSQGRVIAGGFNLDGPYIFPSSTIFRHIGTELSGPNAIPGQATYGNFSVLPNPLSNEPAISTIKGSGYDLTFGGNVLDVYGTKFGVGDILKIVLPQDLSVLNHITMGGNILAGFGSAYGDIQTLTISGGPTAQHSSGGELRIEFRGNILNIDKNVDSIEYPHLQTLELTNTITNDSKITLIFHNSYISGNIGNDVFYGDIQFLGDLQNTALYNGFITGVHVDPPGETGLVTIHAGSNTITYGNNVYVGVQDVENAKGINTYNFTIVGDDFHLSNGKLNANSYEGNYGRPIMQGNAVIKDFDIVHDVLNFQITPNLFKTLDVAHVKNVPVDSLNYGTTFDHDNIIDPVTGNSLGQGTIIRFSGGGSLSLVGVNINSFDAIPQEHLHLDLNLTYSPVTPISPSLQQPLVYGIGPDGIHIHPYIYELDKLFNNSTLANYSVSGDSPNVEFTQAGNITVITDTPYFTPLTINAYTTNPDTHAIDQATSTYLFGFLQAPITSDLTPGATITANPNNFFNGNIFLGGTNATIIGAKASVTYTPDVVQIFEGAPIQLNKPTLISDPYKGASAYGAYENLSFSVQGATNTTISSANAVVQESGPPIAFSDVSITGQVFNTSPIAIYVDGVGYGYAKTLQFDVVGGTDVTTAISKFDTPFNVSATGRFENNIYNISSISIYGSGMDNAFVDPENTQGDLVGNFQDFSVNVLGGNNPPPDPAIQGDTQVPYFSIQKGGATTVHVDLSASFSGNIFRFGEVDITVHGDQAGQTTYLINNIGSFDFNALTRYIRTDLPSYTIKSLGIIANNEFDFAPTQTMTAGLGNTIFVGNIGDLGDPLSNDSTYKGFVKGVTVSNDSETQQIIMTDANGNAIKFSDITYVDGQGTDTMKFLIVQDNNSRPVMQGHNTIYNFDPTAAIPDVIQFNITSNLFAKLGMQVDQTQANIAILDHYLKVSNGLIQFQGLTPEATQENPTPDAQDYGSLLIYGYNYTADSLMDIYNVNPNSIVIERVGSPYTPPTLIDPPPVFDPVFISSDVEKAFLLFIKGDPTTLTFSLAGAISVPDQQLPDLKYYHYESAPGIVMDSTGNLSVSPDGPEQAIFDVRVTDTITDLAIPPMHLFAINATDGVKHTNSSDLVQGSVVSDGWTPEFSLAFETSTPGNTIIGGGDDIIIDLTSTAGTQTFGSSLIYDISSASVFGGMIMGHTAIGNVKNITFTNDGTGAASHYDANNNPIVQTLSGHELTFNSNMFNVNAFDSNAASNGAGIYGTDDTLTFSVAGARLYLTDSNSQNQIDLPVDNYITGNKITMNSNTAFGNGILFGNMSALILQILNPTWHEGVGPAGNGYIQGNIFEFKANYLTSTNFSGTGSVTALLDASIGKLVMENKETSLYTHTGTSLIGGLGEGEANVFIFGDSKLTAGHLVVTTFNQDIADMTDTYLATQRVTFTTTDDNHVQITDSYGNLFKPGNLEFKADPGTPATYNIHVLTASTGNPGENDLAVGFGNLSITASGPITDGGPNDTFIFHVTPMAYRLMDSNYNRFINDTEINNLAPNPTHPNTTDTLFSFTGAGTLTLTNLDVDNLSDLKPITQLMYTAQPITPIDNPLDLILSPNLGTGNTNGVYGLILDTYFNNVDVSSKDSTYTITDILDPSYFTQGNVIYPVLSFPASITVSDDNFGTLTATTDAPFSVLKPLLSPVLITANDAHFPGNDPSIQIMLGEFDSQYGSIESDAALSPEPDTNITTFTGASDHPSYLRGTVNQELMVGNVDPVTHDIDFTLTVDGSKNFANSQTTIYGRDSTDYLVNYLFGGNLITNPNADTEAYGTFRNIKIDFTGSGTTSNLIAEFGQNTIDVNGSSFGVADRFILNTQHSATNDMFVFGYVPVTQGGASGPIFGWQTIYGQGIIHGALNTLEVYQNTPGTTSFIFGFAGTEIVITGDQFSIVYSNLNRWVYNNTPTSSTVYFGDTLTIAGTGGGNYYPAVNDMSQTPFWYTTVEDTGSAMRVGEVPLATTSVNWGFHTLILGSGQDTINIDLLDVGLADSTSPHAPTSTGSYLIKGFDVSQDIIRFNISQPLYNFLHADGQITSAELQSAFANTFDFNSFGADDVITFWAPIPNGGMISETITLDNINGSHTFEDFANSNIQIGTTFVGTLNNYPYGQEDIMLSVVNTATSYSSFKEYDQISDFNMGTDAVQVAVPVALYDLGLTSMLMTTTNNSLTAISNALKDSALTSVGGLTVTNTSAQYLTDSGIDVDTNLNFVTNNNTVGSVLIHNVNQTTIADFGSHFELGQLGTDGISDTFTYIIPDNGGHDLTALNSKSFISNFDNIGADADSLQIILSKSTYNALSNANGKVGAVQLEAHTGDSTGGFVVTSNGGNSFLTVTTNNGQFGQIELMGTTISDLSALGSRLHVGYVEAGTAGKDVFTYELTGNRFDGFTQFDHIVGFDVTKDVIQVIVPVNTYYTLNTEGTLSTNALLSALNASATNTLTGGITSIIDSSAQYSGAVNADTILAFRNNLDSVGQYDGAITLHNFNLGGALTNFGNHFQLTSTQNITTAPNDTIAFNAQPNGSNFSSFQQYAHVTNMDISGGNDKIHLLFPLSVFNFISNDGTLNSTQIEDALSSNPYINSSMGGIKVVESNGDTTLNFVTNGNVNNPWGSITLEDVDLPTGNLHDLGSHLLFGSVQQGTTGFDAFEYFAYDTTTTQGTFSPDLSGFKQFSHILDFDNSVSTPDHLIIDISRQLYDTINHAYNPLGPLGTNVTNSQLIDSLASGNANGQNIGAHIDIQTVQAQYSNPNGVAVDSILKFVTDGTVGTTGTITLHNVDLSANGLQTLHNLTVAHA